MGLHCKRLVVRLRKSPLHQLSGIKSLLPLKSFEHLCRDQIAGGRYKIRLSLCPPLETSILVSPQMNSFEGSTHFGALECNSRPTVQTQVIQTEWSLTQQVFNLLCSRWARPHVDLFATRFNHKLPKFVSPVPDLTAWAVDALSLGESGCLCLPSSLSAQPSNLQDDGSRLSQNDSDCSRVAQHALVLGPGQSISSDPLLAPTAKVSSDTTLQRAPLQESQQSESTCLAPRASVIQEQEFSDEVAASIEAPQRVSTRAVYKSKWAIFVKWCESNEVDFWSPSVNQIADFLLHLFKERKLQLSTIKYYKTAIADMVGNDKLNINQDENLTHLLDSFHRDKCRPGTFHWYSTS